MTQGCEPRKRLSRTPLGASSRTAYGGPRLIHSIMNNHIFPRDLDSFLLNKLPRRENVHETDSAQQFRTYAVADHVHNLGSILRGICRSFTPLTRRPATESPVRSSRTNSIGSKMVEAAPWLRQLPGAASVFSPCVWDGAPGRPSRHDTWRWLAYHRSRPSYRHGHLQLHCILGSYEIPLRSARRWPRHYEHRLFAPQKS